MNEKVETNFYFFVHFDLLQVLPLTRSEHQNVPTTSETDRFIFTVNEGGSISKISVEQQKIIETFKIDGAVHNIQGSPDGKVVGAVVVPEMSHGNDRQNMKHCDDAVN